jgi:hypothetical protein
MENETIARINNLKKLIELMQQEIEILVETAEPHRDTATDFIEFFIQRATPFINKNNYIRCLNCVKSTTDQISISPKAVYLDELTEIEFLRLRNSGIKTATLFAEMKEYFIRKKNK